MPGGKTKFNPAWLDKLDNSGCSLSKWCKQDSNCYSAYCFVCCKSISCSNTGLAQLIGHADGQKHKQAMKIRSDKGQTLLFKTQAPGSSRQGGGDVNKELTFLMSSTVNDQVTKAEALWAIQVASCGYSYTSCDSIGELFKAMFPGQITDQFSMSKSKVSYLISDGLGPYFRREISQKIISSKCPFSVQFDETGNAKDKKQCDVLVRFWNDQAGEVYTVFLKSLMFGHAKDCFMLQDTKMDLPNSKGTVTLAASVSQLMLQISKAKALEFLSEFIEKVGKKILPYAVDIKDICLSLFSRDRFARVKNAAIPVLSRLLELTVGSPLGKDLQIDKLITRFFSELTKTTKLTPTVREKIYILLGVIAEVYPEYMTQYAERLTGIYLGALKAEIGSKTRKPEFSIIAGCLEGLCSSLVNFTESADEGSKNAYEIFKYARNAIDPKVEFTRFDVPRAGLRLFARHASQFSQFLFEDYQNLYEKMSFWSHHKNSEMVLLGMKAIESFLTQVSEMLVEKAKDGKKDGVGIFKYFVQQFQEIMHNDSARAKELSLAIRGYGLLAAPCRSYLKEEDVQFMFVEMLNKTEQQFLGQAEDFENRLFNLASYLESLASIIRHLDDVTDAHATSLEHLLVLLLENIPNIHSSKHYICMRAILWVLLAVMPKGTTFKQILSGFVFQGLIRTCSYAPVVETTENETEAVPDDFQAKKITYRDFMETWSGMLDAAKIKDFAAADISIETRHQLTEALYNELMVAILKILDKLDLSSTAPTEGEEGSVDLEDIDESGLSSADPLLGVQAKKPKDFQVFINLVDFCKDLLPVKHYQKFECWVFTFTHRLILMSTDNPLASGFYKLLAISMKIANKLHYFQNQNLLPLPSKMKTEVKEEPMEIDTEGQEGNQQKMTCFLLVKKFSKEVLVRMKQYRDELLASCLTFILSLPKEVISEQMADVVPAIQVTLNLGLSYLPLAMVAMDALEFWSSSLPTHVMLPFYPKILPCLDSFLKTSDQGADDVSVNITKSKTGKGRKKLSVKLIKGKKETSAQSYQSQLSTIKKRIMKYLGNLGGSINMGLLANDDEEISQKAIAWDSIQHLKFDVPFEDMKPTIYLDAFLPHLVDLATKSSDRQTKVAACELLHSLIIYCLGRSAQQPGARVERASMAGLYMKLFPAMLKLSCDVEQVAKQLFEPLAMQLIHWFTSSKQSGNEERDALLDAVYDGMIQSSDTALRDFSARCLHEFLKWSIKQTTSKALETNPANVQSVLKRLYSYSLHPNPFKRLGAALAFNNIYTVFREEEPLVNMFTFELLVHFVESLAIAHGDEKSLGTQEQCCKALEHLEKIIRHKAALLRNPSKIRTEPKAWSTPTLDIAVRWLLRQCGRPQTECRHACMKLSYQLCTLVPGIKSPVKFFQYFCTDKGPEYFIQRFEGGGHMGTDKQGIEGFPTLDKVAPVFSLETALSWFDMVLAALDCYTWVFGENLLTPADLFGAKSKDGSRPHVFDSLQYFLVKIASVDMETVAELFSKKGQADFYTPKEKDDFNTAKCTVIVRLLGFLTVMLAKYKKETLSVVPKEIWKSELWQLICACVVEPSAVGFNMGDVEIMKNLPQEMNQTLAVFSKTFKNEMAGSFSKFLSGNRNLVTSLPLALDDPVLDHLRLKQLLSGYGQFHSVGLLLPCLQKTKQDVFCEKLFDNVYKGISVKTSGNITSVTLTPTALMVAKEMLTLSFSLGLPTKRLVEAVLDKVRVRSASQASEQAYGDMFFSLFRSTICRYCVTCIKEVVPLLMKRVESDSRRVCTILTSTVDLVCRDRELRKKDGAAVLECVLSEWKSFSPWWETKGSCDLQGLALLLLTKLLLIDSKFACTPSHPAFEDVFSMYQTLLTDTRTTLSFKCRVLELLPFFATAPEDHAAKLKGSLDRLVADNFPLRSSEFPKGSPKYQDYITAVDKILSALQLSGSLMLLEFLISIFCRETQHVHEDEIQNALDKFIRRLGRDKQKAAMDVPWKIFVKTGSFPPEIRRATIERVCLSMLRICSKSALLEFFLDHIVQIKELLEVKLSKSSEAVLEGQLVTRLCCFQLLEVLYSRCSKDEVVGTGSTIVRTFAHGKVETGKELTVFVSKLTQEAKSEDIRSETMLLELRRQYHCAAYNLMIAFISRTQSELKFYTSFLFEEKLSKGQFLLDNFIDRDMKYEFPIELISPLERKKRFVSIHQEVKEQRQNEGDDSYDDITPSVHLATQYLADSSLSEDISQYNFSISGTASSWSSQADRRRNRSRVQRNPEEARKESGPDVEVTLEEDYVELEMDPLNQHECMAAMIAVIKHMDRAKITPEVTAGTKPKMPSWMEKLHDKMTSSSTHYNVKLFIAKLIGNTADVFQPYASYWIKPFCQLIISGPLSGGGINYFIVDLIVTMLGWHKTAIPQDTAEEKAMASRLVHFIFKNIYHESRPVFRNNLEMLKTLLECWKDRVEIPYQEIYSQLQAVDPKSKDNGVGIQVLGVVIACKFPPYGPSAPVDRERFFAKVANNMGSTHKTIYAPAAEVVGLIFHYLAEKEDEQDGSFHAYVSNFMTNLHKAKPDNFITSVNRMQKHHPPIADRFLNKLLFMLPNLHGEFRTLCLEILHSRIDQVENVFLELKSKGIMTSLSHRDEATQLISLKIIKAVAAKLKSDELSLLMSPITAFGVHPSASCRLVMFDILMWIYDNYKDEDSEVAHSIMQQTKESLLRGLGDDDQHCKLQVQNFWSSETRLPRGTLDRMVAMLEAMYSPVTEQQYLSYATNLLLEMTSKSPDYQKEIFEFPLSECKFSDYAVKSSWRQRHAAMTPLFATLASQSAAMDYEESIDGQVRATQDVQQFTQTQDAGASKGPYNWLTQSSLDTYSDVSIVPMDTQVSQSSLLFTVGTADSQGRRKRPRPGPGFGKQRLAAPKTAAAVKKEEPESGSELLRLKRRFLKDQEQSRIFFAKRQTRIKQMREIALQEQKTRRENQVTIYRKYRSGDLPDIQIKYSYIIAPLQALAHRDSTIAKLLFGMVFKAIFEKMGDVKTERELEETVSQINSSVDNILSASTQYFPPFIGCVLDILYQLRRSLKVDVANVGAAAVFSKLQPLGITLLEEQLIIHEPAEARASKRSRTDTQVSTDVAHWIELSRLYKTIENYDVLLGIFSGKLGTQEITQKAIEAEARGDYSAAKKLYEEALQCTDWPDEPPLEPEVDLWDDCRMDCLANLAQWDDLEVVSTSAIDDASSPELIKVWEDTFLQEHYLPFILQSKVKLMLQGDENQQSLLNFVDSSMKVPERKLILENRYSQELALMYLWQEDYDRARHYTNMAQEFFLQEWSSTDSLMSSSRSTSLQKLQPLTELQEFLQFMADENNFSSLQPAKRLVREWSRRSPDVLTDPVGVWDDVVTNRYVYLDHISSHLQKVEPDSQDSVDLEAGDIFLDTKLRLKLKMAESCKEQNNFTLTLRILKETHTSCKRAEDESLMCDWTHLYASTHHKKTRVAMSEMTEDNINSVFTTLDQLKKLDDTECLTEKPSMSRRHHVLSGQGYELLALAVQGYSSIKDLSGSRLEQKFLDYAGITKLNKQELTEQLIQNGYYRMKTSVSIEDAVHKSSVKSAQFPQDEAFIAAAKYCDTFLRLKENDELEVSGGSLKSFPDTIIICLLKAIKMENTEARQRFPRLLQLVEMYPDTMATFVAKSKEVPSWLFLMWISQMLAVLDKPEAPAVHSIVDDLSALYPQAVVYPLKLSQEGYSFGSSSKDVKNRQFVERVKSQLCDDRASLTSKFMAALECFSQPDQDFKDFFENMKKLVRKKDRVAIKSEYISMYERMLNYPKPATQQSSRGGKSKSTQESGGGESVNTQQDPATDIGSYARKWSDKYKKEFDKVFGSDGSKLINMSYDDFVKHKSSFLTKFNGDIKGKDDTLKPPSKLSEYSAWMSRFNPNTQGRGLEIPGQYTGINKPLPEYHVKIAGFDQRVLVMSSLRKPKRITIRGNDEKDYNYLVKGGEDLRQDQRIEQLFFIMNQVFNRDPACRQRKLFLATYQVIPVTTRVGLIEWVANTKPLKEFLYGSLTDAEKRQNPGTTHDEWIRKASRKEEKDFSKCYQNVYSKYSYTDTQREMNVIESKFPWDLSRRSFHNISTSPEAFHVLRCKCVQTHAVICISQYIIGIGDRHLSNFMVNMRTGEMVGIDFGHAFGSATTFLPVPELLPFRLTRQLRNLMMPLGVKGLIESTMIHTLRALRSDSDLLLNTMDIFVKEPSLDWLQNAERQMQTMNKEDFDAYDVGSDTKMDWYPKEKINYVKRKLKGDNPAYITRDELKLGHGKKPAFKDFELVALGMKDNVRAQLPPSGLTVEQQVSALIDQVTDPNILGRTWIGWEAWV